MRAPSRSAAGQLAAVMVAGVVAAGTGVVLAPAASAKTVDYTAHCVNQTAPNQPVADAPLAMDLAVTPSKPIYQVGDTVQVTWSWKTYPRVPRNSPPATVAANSTLPDGRIVVGGAQTGSVDVTGKRTNPAATQGQALHLSDMTGTVRLTTPGTVTLTPGAFQQDTAVTPSTGAAATHAKTSCTPVNPVAAAATFTVSDRTPVPDPSLTLTPNIVTPDGALALAGDNWPDGTPTLALCTADGTGCRPDLLSRNTATIAAGRLTGTATVASTTPSGTYQLRVTSATRQASAKVTVVAAATTTPGAPSAAPTGAGQPRAVTAGPQLADGALTFTQSGTAIDFGTIALDGTPKTAKGTLNQVTVTDGRSGGPNWSLSGTMSDLTGPGGAVIPAGNLSWTPACTGTGVATGSPSALGATPATLCSAPQDPARAPGAQYTADAALVLAAPTFAASGAYSGTLTLSLS